MLTRVGEVKFMLTILTLATVILCGSDRAQAQGERVDLTVGAIEISLELPVGMRPFSEEQMVEYREKGGAGKYVFSVSQGELIAIINTFGSGASDKGLGGVADRIETDTGEQGASVGGFVRRFMKLNGRKWLYLSFHEKAAADLINECFVTAWGDQYVLIEFSSEAPKYESYKSAVARSARSVRLGLIAESIEVDPSTTPAKKN